MRRFSLIVFKTIFLTVLLGLKPNALMADVPSASLDGLQKVVQEMQTQLRDYQTQMEKQAQVIEIQGEAIAELKTRLEGKVIPDATREQVRSVLEEFRLSERQAIPEDKELRTIYDDGFYLKGKDDTLRLGGWYQGDVNIYDKGNEGDSRFRNRRVRLDIRGVLEDDFEYRLYSQFAGTSANLQEAWVMYKHFPDARLKFGQFKVPFSLESQYSARWIDFIERSIGVTNLQPAEDVGIMLYGNPFGGMVEYGTGVFNGRLRTLEDNNDAFDFAARLVLAPFKKMEDELLRDFFVGASVTTGSRLETLSATSFTTAGGSAFFTFATPTRHADNRTRYGTELQWIYGPGDIKAEYLRVRFSDVERSGVKDDMQVDSWYVSATHVLTGERKVKNKGIDPKKNFSFRDGGMGAWEVGLRFEQFIMNGSPFDFGLGRGTDRVDAVTGGLNWWLNKHIRLMFNYAYNRFQDPVQIGSEFQDNEHLILGRAQYDF